jgi:hypothetical protein
MRIRQEHRGARDSGCHRRLETLRQPGKVRLLRFAATEVGDPSVDEECLPIIHLVFTNLKSWLLGIHYGVSHQHCTFRPA